MKPASRKRLLDWKAALGIVISAAALYWVFKDQDLGDILAEVRQANPVYFSLATFCATFVFWIRAWRWKALIDPVRTGTSFRSRFGATVIGFMGSNIFPARVGEFMRPLALSRAEGLPVVACFTSIVLERMLDALTVIGLLFLSMTLPLPSLRGAEKHMGNAQTIGLAMLVLLAVLIAFVIWPRRAVRIAERMVAPLPAKVQRPIIDSLEAFLKGASALRNPTVLLRAGSWSIALWLVNAIGFWLAFKAFGLPFNLNAALFFQGLLVVGVAIPSGPGFFGVYEGWARVVLVSMWGANATTANAFAAAYHIAGFIPVTVIGLYYAHRFGISARDAAGSEETVEESVENDTSIERG
jgi:glycosyltransferase 2 family protein